MEILLISDTSMVLGAPLGNFLFDSKVAIDRANGEIEVYRRVFGYPSRRSIPFEKVQGIKMSTSMGANYRYARGPRGLMRLYDTPKARLDIWIDAMELGRIRLASYYGPKSRTEEIAAMGRKVANFMEKSFVDTSKS